MPTSSGRSTSQQYGPHGGAIGAEQKVHRACGERRRLLRPLGARQEHDE